MTDFDPPYGPCEPWAMASDLCDPSVTGAPPALIDRSLVMATEVLWARSGRQFGTCTITVRPCSRRCLVSTWAVAGPGPTPPYVPLNLGYGVWTNVGCCSSDGCSHTSVSVLDLQAQVAGIVSVKVDGVVLDPSEYLLYDGRLLYRAGGDWPATQDLTKLDTEPGTWSVTYRTGLPVPTIGVQAVAELAGQFILACTPGAKCKLPAKVQTITRQGVTVQLRSADLKGIGLDLCDQFLDAFNPEGLAQPPGVYSIDAPPPKMGRRSFLSVDGGGS